LVSKELACAATAALHSLRAGQALRNDLSAQGKIA